MSLTESNRFKDWQEWSKTDDRMERFVLSDIREMLGEIGRLQHDLLIAQKNHQNVVDTKRKTSKRLGSALRKLDAANNVIQAIFDTSLPDGALRRAAEAYIAECFSADEGGGDAQASDSSVVTEQSLLVGIPSFPLVGTDPSRADLLMRGGVMERAMTREQGDVMFSSYLGICELEETLRAAGLFRGAQRAHDMVDDIEQMFPVVIERRREIEQRLVRGGEKK